MSPGNGQIVAKVALRTDHCDRQDTSRQDKSCGTIAEYRAGVLCVLTHRCQSHAQFQQWRERRAPSMLLVSANPGCGKPVVAKHLLDSVLRITQSRTTSRTKRPRQALSAVSYIGFSRQERYYSLTNSSTASKLIRNTTLRAHLMSSGVSWLWLHGTRSGMIVVWNVRAG